MQSWGFEGSVNWSILTDRKEAEQFYWRQGHTWGQGSLGYYCYLNLVISRTAFIVDVTCCVWSISRSEIFSQSWPSHFLLLLLLRVEWTLHGQKVWRQFPKFHPLTSLYFSLICNQIVDAEFYGDMLNDGWCGMTLYSRYIHIYFFVKPYSCLQTFIVSKLKI